MIPKIFESRIRLYENIFEEDKNFEEIDNLSGVITKIQIEASEAAKFERDCCSECGDVRILDLFLLAFRRNRKIIEDFFSELSDPERPDLTDLQLFCKQVDRQKTEDKKKKLEVKTPSAETIKAEFKGIDSFALISLVEEASQPSAFEMQIGDFIKEKNITQIEEEEKEQLDESESVNAWRQLEPLDDGQQQEDEDIGKAVEYKCNPGNWIWMVNDDEPFEILVEALPLDMGKEDKIKMICRAITGDITKEEVEERYEISLESTGHAVIERGQEDVDFQGKGISVRSNVDLLQKQFVHSDDEEENFEQKLMNNNNNLSVSRKRKEMSPEKKEVEQPQTQTKVDTWTKPAEQPQTTEETWTEIELNLIQNLVKKFADTDYDFDKKFELISRMFPSKSIKSLEDKILELEKTKPSKQPQMKEDTWTEIELNLIQNLMKKFADTDCDFDEKVERISRMFPSKSVKGLEDKILEFEKTKVVEAWTKDEDRELVGLWIEVNKEDMTMEEKIQEIQVNFEGKNVRLRLEELEFLNVSRKRRFEESWAEKESRKLKLLMEVIPGHDFERKSHWCKAIAAHFTNRNYFSVESRIIQLEETEKRSEAQEVLQKAPQPQVETSRQQPMANDAVQPQVNLNQGNQNKVNLHQLNRNQVNLHLLNVNQNHVENNSASQKMEGTKKGQPMETVSSPWSIEEVNRLINSLELNRSSYFTSERERYEEIKRDFPSRSLEEVQKKIEEIKMPQIQKAVDKENHPARSEVAQSTVTQVEPWSNEDVENLKQFLNVFPARNFVKIETRQRLIAGKFFYRSLEEVVRKMNELEPKPYPTTLKEAEENHKPYPSTLKEAENFPSPPKNNAVQQMKVPALQSLKPVDLNTTANVEKRGKWSPEEVKELNRLTEEHPVANFASIVDRCRYFMERLPSKSQDQIYHKILQENKKKAKKLEKSVLESSRVEDQHESSNELDVTYDSSKDPNVTIGSTKINKWSDEENAILKDLLANTPDSQYMSKADKYRAFAKKLPQKSWKQIMSKVTNNEALAKKKEIKAEVEDEQDPPVTKVQMGTTSPTVVKEIKKVIIESPEKTDVQDSGWENMDLDEEEEDGADKPPMSPEADWTEDELQELNVLMSAFPERRFETKEARYKAISEEFQEKKLENVTQKILEVESNKAKDKVEKKEIDVVDTQEDDKSAKQKIEEMMKANQDDGFNDSSDEEADGKEEDEQNDSSGAVVYSDEEEEEQGEIKAMDNVETNNNVKPPGPPEMIVTYGDVKKTWLHDDKEEFSLLLKMYPKERFVGKCSLRYKEIYENLESTVPLENIVRRIFDQEGQTSLEEFVKSNPVPKEPEEKKIWTKILREMFKDKGSDYLAKREEN